MNWSPREFLKYIPPQYRLPIWLAVKNQFRKTEPELRNIRRLLPIDRRLVAIDVGANIGFYALALSHFYKRVYAFEVNPKITMMLKSLNRKNIQLVEKGLSDCTATKTLFIPIINEKTELDGWASFNPRNYAETHLTREQVVPVIALDSLGINDVGFMKIDVEGHEYEVLQGARITLERSRPNILIEIKKDNFERTSKLLREYGYAEVSLTSLIRTEKTEENYFFVPA